MPTSQSQAVSRPSARAHRESVQEDFASVVEFLVELLGVRLTAHMAGVQRTTVSRWQAGTHRPHDASTEQKLRDARQIATVLLAADNIHTVRAWFIGMNPQLDDEAPLEVIARGNSRAAMSAARSFVSTA